MNNLEKIVVSLKDSRPLVKIGWTGENQARGIIWDISKWQEVYGDGICTLLNQREQDTAPYPCPVTIDGKFAVWQVTDGDLGSGGNGKCQLIYTVGDEVVAKSPVYRTLASRSLDSANNEPPERYESWIEELIAAGAQTDQALQDALKEIDDSGIQTVEIIEETKANSVEAVNKAKQSAETSISDAEAGAVKAVESTKETAVQRVQAAQTSATDTITEKQENAVQAVETQKTAALEAITNAEQSAVNTIDSSGKEAIQNAQSQITDKKNQAVSDIQSAGTAAIKAVENTKETVIQAVEEKQEQALDDIEHSLSNAGHIDFEVRNDGHVYMIRTRTTPDDINFKLESGRLIVIYGT